MTVEQRIIGRKIGIIGMARSGLAAALLGQRLGAEMFVSDSATVGKLADQIAKLQKENIPFETGGHSQRVLQSDYLIVSPGVPPSIDILSRAKDEGIPIFSEIEFASWVCRGRIVAITGSNGKTTTTTLLGEIFAAAGINPIVCGNIGLPFSQVAHQVNSGTVVVLEVSNYQLETIEEFHPDIAVLLNLTPDHLDRHGNFEAYKKAKFRITENQNSDDTLVLNNDDAETIAADIQTGASKRTFSTAGVDATGAFVSSGTLFGMYGREMRKIIDASEILIPGPHNLQNAAAAVCVASLFDIPPETIADVLRTFPGVEHRMESCGRVAGIHFVNDSKATNVDSVCYALRSIDTNVHLIVGGRDKGASYAPLIEHGTGKIRSVIAIGEAKQKIQLELGGSFEVQFAESLTEAVGICFENAHPGDTVLLSPACASFDMFENFEQRGRSFKKAVAELNESRTNNETPTH